MLKKMTILLLPILMAQPVFSLCHAAEALPRKLMAASAPAVSDKSGNATLYKANCAVCHGQAKRGEPSSRIGNAIKKNIGGMGSLKFLTSEQIRTVTDF